jgi:L-ribulose-5-phosphate 3-epimerase
VKISCVSYSYVAEPHDYAAEAEAGPGTAGQATTRQGTAGRETPQARVLAFVDSVLERLRGGLLDGLEFWFAHVPADILTPLLAREIRRRLSASDLAPAACGGSVGNPAADPDGCETWFQVTSMLHAPLIAGDVVPQGLDELARLCARYRVRVAYENHPERDVAEILERIKGGNEWVGVTLDTGSLAEHGGDPVRAVRQLGDRLMHVHMRDVPAVGSELSVPIGSGIVDVPGVLTELAHAGYQGWVSIEIPLETGDPSTTILDAARMIRRLGDR